MFCQLPCLDKKNFVTYTSKMEEQISSRKYDPDYCKENRYYRLRMWYWYIPEISKYLMIAIALVTLVMYGYFISMIFDLTPRGFLLTFPFIVGWFVAGSIGYRPYHFWWVPDIIDADLKYKGDLSTRNDTVGENLEIPANKAIRIFIFCVSAQIMLLEFSLTLFAIFGPMTLGAVAGAKFMAYVFFPEPFFLAFTLAVSLFYLFFIMNIFQKNKELETSLKEEIEEYEKLTRKGRSKKKIDDWEYPYKERKHLYFNTIYDVEQLIHQKMNLEAALFTILASVFNIFLYSLYEYKLALMY